MRRTQRIYREVQFFTQRLKRKMEPRRFPRRPDTPMPMMRKIFDPDLPCDFGFKKSVKIEDQDHALRNSILKLPKIKKDIHPTPIPQRKVEIREDCVDIQENSATSNSNSSTSSGFLLSLVDGIDIQARIDQRNKFRKEQEMKERHEAALRKLQEKKPRPTNAYARDVQNWRDKREKTPSKTLLQIDRDGQKLLNLSTDVDKFKADKLRACPKLIVLSNEDSGKDKHGIQFKKSLSRGNEQKFIKQVSEKAEERLVKPRQTPRVSEGKRSEYVHDEREKNVHEQVKFQEKCKKMAYENIENIRRKEYVKEAVEEKKLNQEKAKQEFAQKLLDKQEKEKKVKMQKYLTDAWDDQVEYKRQKQIEMDKIINKGSDSLMDCDIPDKDRSREIRKKIVYDQLSLTKKEEAKKRAFMEEKLLKERKDRESAEHKREKLEKEKKAAAIKSLTNSWDSRIQLKRQEKKEQCEIERKNMQTLMELDRVCGAAKEVLLPGRTTSLAESARRSARRSVGTADKHDDTRNRPILSSQKVRKPVTLPLLKSTSVHFAEDHQQQNKRVKFPSISSPR